MGGYSSGRYRTRNRGSIESAQRLDMRSIRRLGWLKPGAVCSGVMTWSRGGERVASMTITANLTNQSAPFLTLAHTVGGEPHDLRIGMEAVPCRFGGHRFYFICPRTWRRCIVLAFGGGQFASREAQRLAYSSQSEDALGRLHRARRKAEARLRGEGEFVRPRGANRERLLERWIDLEMAPTTCWRKRSRDDGEWSSERRSPASVWLRSSTRTVAYLFGRRDN